MKESFDKLVYMSVFWVNSVIVIRHRIMLESKEQLIHGALKTKMKS